MLADSSEGKWLSTERLANHSRDKNKKVERTDAIYQLQGRQQAG